MLRSFGRCRPHPGHVVRHFDIVPQHVNQNETSSDNFGRLGPTGKGAPGQFLICGRQLISRHRTHRRWDVDRVCRIWTEVDKPWKMSAKCRSRIGPASTTVEYCRSNSVQCKWPPIGTIPATATKIGLLCLGCAGNAPRIAIAQNCSKSPKIGRARPQISRIRQPS